MHKNSPYISTPRQKRAIEALQENQMINVKDLGALIGACNPAQVIRELRLQGFSEIIQTHRMVMKDRDGKICYPGVYYIPDALKAQASKALKKYATSTGTTVKAACKSSQPNVNGGM